MAQYIDLFVDQGSTYATQIPVYGPNKVPRDCTGFLVRAQLRKSYFSTSAVSFETSIPNPTNGIVVISLDAETTGSLKPGRYVYDVEIYNDTEVYRIAEGQVEINPRVTR